MKFKIVFLVFILTLISTTSVFADKINLVPNSGFEEGSGDDAYFWAKDSWENKGEFKWDSSQKHSGRKSICVINNTPSDSRYKQQIKVKGNSYYKLSCWIKTENVGSNNKGANLSIEGLLDTSMDIKGTSNEWKNVELYGKTSENQTSFAVTLGLGGYGSLNSGKAWFDDVVVEELNSAPVGVNIINLYAPNTVSTAADGKSKSTVWVIISALFILFIIALGYLILKSKEITPVNTPGNKSTGYTSTPEVNNPGVKPDKKDMLIIASLTLVYLVVAIYNLGSLNVPKTSWKPVKPGENFVLDLGREVNISRIYYYCGLGDGRLADGKFRVEYMDGSGRFNQLVTIEKKDIFIWKYVNVPAAKTNRIKIIADSPGGTLNEVGIFESDSRKPVSSIKIIEKNLDPDDAGVIENLFDEQNTIEYAPSFMTGMYFDEIYHARTAYEHLNHIEPFESTHPPLGKILIALGIAVFGMNPFGWRIIGTLFGAAMIPLMYIFGKKLFNKRFYAFCSAFLMTFDFMHFAQTRIATIDVYVTFFIILMFYYMYDYYINKSYLLGFRQSLKPLFLSGLFFGLGAASKWIALYGAFGLALLFFLAKYNEFKDYMKLANIKLANKKPKKNTWVQDFIPLYINRTILYCILFFGIIPGIIYILSYIPFMMVPGPGHGLKDVFTYQIHMYNYHKNLVATHSFSSKWWEWPIMTKPLWFYGGTDLPSGKVSTIVSLGNPAVWWVGIFAVIASIGIAIGKRDKKMFVLFTAITFQYLPWMLVPRIAFIYHFFSIVPFVILSIVYVIKYVLERHPETKYFVYFYLAVVAILFIAFYPVLSGMTVDRAYVDSLKWLKSWIF